MNDQAHTVDKEPKEGEEQAKQGEFFALWVDRYGQRGWSGPFPDGDGPELAVPDGARSSVTARALPAMTPDEGEGLSPGGSLALHLACAHDDDEARLRDDDQNAAVHGAILLHQHSGAQYRRERALAEKTEADAGGGAPKGWLPVPHAPYPVTDLARMIAAMHDQEPGMPSDLMAVDLAWIKTGSWPWHRRVRAAALLAFSPLRPPSGYLGQGPGEWRP